MSEASDARGVAWVRGVEGQGFGGKKEELGLKQKQVEARGLAL